MLCASRLLRNGDLVHHKKREARFNGNAYFCNINRTKAEFLQIKNHPLNHLLTTKQKHGAISANNAGGGSETGLGLC